MNTLTPADTIKNAATGLSHGLLIFARAIPIENAPGIKFITMVYVRKIGEGLFGNQFDHINNNSAK